MDDIVHIIATGYGWTEDYILENFTIPEAMEKANRIMRDRAMDKYDMFICSSAPNSKKVKQIGNGYYKRVKRFDKKLNPIKEELSFEEERELAYLLGGGKIFDKLTKK